LYLERNLILGKRLRQGLLLWLPGSAPFDANESNEHAQKSKGNGKQQRGPEAAD
jgi:hypothetical protein